MATNPVQNNGNAYLIPIQNAINPPPLPRNNHGDDDEDLFNSIPLGYRFCPTDVELINEYLLKKINNQPLPLSRIHEVNLYDFNPEFLAASYKETGENEWYFFTPREKKYRNGSRPNRAAGDGYWKASGANKLIRLDDGKKIGYRRSLSYHKGKAMKGDQTCWLMTEYTVENPPPPLHTTHNHMRLDDWVLCRIYITTKGLSKSNQRDKAEDDGGASTQVAN